MAGRASRGRTALIGLVTSFAAASLALAAPANGAVIVAVQPFWADTRVGEHHQDSDLHLTNLSEAPDATLRFGEITLYPACTTTAPDCAGGTAEQGVFGFSGAHGSPGNPTCEGIWTITPFHANYHLNDRYRLIPPQGEGTLTLGPGELCTVSLFGFTARMPALDVQPDTPGVQTFHVLAVTPLQPTGLPAGGRTGGADASTVIPATLGLDVEAGAVSDTVPTRTGAATGLRAVLPLTASSGDPPTGTITFTLYGPDAACSDPPVFQTLVPVDGLNHYRSTLTIVRLPGTYRWLASYSGDSNYLPIPSTLCDDALVTLTPRRPVADFDGDLKTDLSVIRPPTHAWFAAKSAGGGSAGNYGVTGDLPVPGDYGNDNKADVAVYRPGSPATWFILKSSFGEDALNFGADGDVPVPADYDGDGDIDVAVFRPTTATWFIYGPEVVTGTFGTPGDLPVPADYDGDGIDDIAVFRPPTATWFVSLSGGGSRAGNFGVEGDIPVPADYDGDALVDIAVFRPTTGTWFVDRSTGGLLAGNFGMPGDVPVPGDYDGDLKDDLAVFRPASATWFVNKSTDGVLAGNYGVPGDVPLPLPVAVWLAFYGNPF